MGTGRLVFEQMLDRHRYEPQELGARCDKCILKEIRIGGPVGPSFDPDNKIAVIAESPGDKEVERNRPLVGASGLEFNNALQAVGINRSILNIHHALACQPPENDLDKALLKLQRENKKRAKEGLEILPSPIDCCRPRLLSEIDETQNIITLGKVAYQAISGQQKSITEIRGGPVVGYYNEHSQFVAGEADPTQYAFAVKVLPTLHPSFVIRMRRWSRAFKADLSRAFRWFTVGLNWKEPEITVNPTPQQLAAFLSNPDANYVVDVETSFDDPTVADLRTVGIGTEEAAVVCVLKSIETGASAYTNSDDLRVREILKAFFENEQILKVGQNLGYFDQMVIRQHFGVDMKPILDTILMHRVVEPELPHKLAYIGSVYTDVVAWKAAHTAAVAATDQELATYCVFHGTMVQLADGAVLPIHEIVEKRLSVLVQSRDPKTGSITQKRVTNWFRQTVRGQKWRAIRLATTTAAGRGLIVTPEHEIHTSRGRVRAEDVRVGDDVFINERQISREQMAAIIGTLLGDSTLVVSPSHRKNRFAASRAALQGGHKTESGFAQYKAQRLSGIIQLKAERPERSICVRGVVATSKPFTPFASPMLHQLAGLQQLIMDADGSRRLRITAMSSAGPLGMAWWFMDDGCLQRAGGFGKADSICISIQRYPEADAKAAQQWLSDQFGRIYLGKDRVLRFSPAAARAFGEYIAPYLPPMARYKLPRDWNFPDYDSREWGASNDFTVARVVAVSDYHPPRTAKHQRIRADTRYCLEVEDTHNFMTADGLVQNCAIDTAVTARVAPQLATAVKLRGQLDVMRYDHRIQRVCLGLHENGMFVDRKARDEVAKQLLGAMAKYRKEADSIVGRPVNLNSVYQLRDLIFGEWKVQPAEYTKLGDPSTNDESIRTMRTANKGNAQVVSFFDALRRYRKVAKEYGTYVRRLIPYGVPLDSAVGFLNEDEEEEANRGLIMADGRIRPDYNAHGTTSGRLSSSNPNAQNVPKHLRKLIIPQPGCVIVGADADQLELRIITAIAQIKVYLEAFADKKDPHAMTASLMFGKNFDQLVPKSSQWDKLRNLSKGIKYASFYGSGDETVHGIITSAEDKEGNLLYPDLTVREVSTIRRNWLNGIPELPRFWEDRMEEFRSNGFVLDPVWGRRRDFLDGEAFNEIINHPIQSSGAAIVHLSTFDLLEEIPFEKWGKGTGLISQVHDALYVEVPCDHPKYEGKDAEFNWCPPKCRCQANWAARTIEKHMNREVPGLDGVVFSAKAKIGKNWSEV